MNDDKTRIDILRSNIFCLEMKDRLSIFDFESLSDMKRELRELEKRMKDSTLKVG